MMTAKEALKRCGLPVVAAVCAVALVFLSACEDDPDMGNTEGYFNSNPYSSDGRVDIPVDNKMLMMTPTSAQVTQPGQMFDFQVSGGYPPYQWRVADSDSGTVTPNETGSDTAVYKAGIVGNNVVIATDTQGRSASAQVSTTLSVALDIIPDDASLSGGGGQIQFTVTGGYAPYQWVSALPALGTIDADGLYSDAGANGTNTVTVIDAQGSAESATVIQD